MHWPVRVISTCMDMPSNEVTVIWSLHVLLHLLVLWFHIVRTDLQLELSPGGLSMDVCLQANVLINEWVCTWDLCDSYGFKADVNCWLYRVGQHQPGVTTLGLNKSGQAALPSPSGVAKRTQPFYRRGGKCWVSVSRRGNSCNYTPQPLLSPPCLPHHQYPLCPNICPTP